MVTPADLDLTSEEELPGRPIDPQLLALIQRVAHREHLFIGTDAARPDISLTRRRPATRSSVRRTTRGTTARKVTWSR